jgi:pimeloyl-ACP methyl ester carboxylesterase
MRSVWAARLIPAAAEQAWFMPPPLGTRTADRDRAATADLDRLVVPFEDGGLTGFEVGRGPLVLGVHGWGGRAAQMAAIARGLAAEGWRVAALDLPGHAGDRRTNLQVTARAITAATASLGEAEAVVAHSLGAMTLRVSFPRSAPPSIVMIAPLVTVSDALAVFGERLHLAPWTRRRLRARLQRWNPKLWASIDGIMPGQFPGSDMLVLHDPADPETSFAAAAQLAALRPRTTIVPAFGAGHSRILSDPATVDLIVSFLGARIRSTAS